MTELSRRDLNRLLIAGVAGAACFASSADAARLHGFRLHPTKGPIAMTNQLSDFTVDHFETLVGETFVIDGRETTLTAVRRGPPTPSRFREQFALSFATPEGTSIRSEVVPVSHPLIGSHDLLVTQVMHSDSPTALEICFG